MDSLKALLKFRYLAGLRPRNQRRLLYLRTIPGSPGCEPARCGRTRRQPNMKIARTAEASGRLSARPPWSLGLSRKSPTVAPNGRVKINAVQNSVTRETLAQ